MQVKDMTLREKIGQTIMIQHPQEYIDRFGSVKNFLEKYPIGSLYIGSEIAGAPIGESSAEKDMIEEFKKCSKQPFLIGGDFNSRISGNMFFKLPNQMALGATDDEQLAYEWGVMIGSAARKAGLHWIFMPVADLNLNINNPVINIRSLTDNPELTERLLTKVVQGIQDCGVAATAKHFPGCGADDIDVHVTRSDSTQTKDEWDKTYGRAFSAMINEGVASVMTTHGSLPCYQSENECVDGLYKTATVSKDITTGLLKEKLGFEGVVVTDGLIMGGFSGSNCELEIEAFLAGSDILLWPTLEYMDVLEQKILSGEIPESRLDDAVERILKLKQQTYLMQDFEEKSIDSEKIVKEAAEKSITLLSNKNHLLPIDKNKIKNILLVLVSARKESVEEMKKLKDIFERYGINVTIEGDIWIPKLREHEKNNDLIIFAISRTPGGIGSIDIYGDNAVSVWASQASDKSKTVIASFGNPYLFKKYYKHIETYINAYSSTEESLEAFVKCIFGEIPFVGKSPVEL